MVPATRSEESFGTSSRIHRRLRDILPRQNAGSVAAGLNLLIGARTNLPKAESTWIQIKRMVQSTTSMVPARRKAIIER
jgi:hypothetical protein